MDYANVDEQNLNFENLSGGESAEESIEEEDRSNEIKELFAAAFSEETFDEDEDDDDEDDESEQSFAQNSKDQSSSIHLSTNNIGNSNNFKSNLRTSNHKQGVPIKKVNNVVGSKEFSVPPNITKIPTPTTSNNNKHKAAAPPPTIASTNNENGLNSFFNGIGLDQNNHKINGGSSSNTGGFIMNGSNSNNNNSNNSNGAGNSGGKKVVRFQQPQHNNHPNHKTNNNMDKNNDPVIGRENQNGKGRQSERGIDEIEITNPTISLLHQNHCPQNGDEISSELWTESANDLEQLKTLCHLRERQVERSEENVKVLEKDKRSLNHQIGLMKTEMIQMKKQQDDLEKLLQQREEDIRYLKTKMIEAIEEYEQAQREEKYAKDETLRYRDEIEKLKQQVELLSSIGSSTQQAEIDQVVRQIREKHSKEVSMWQQTVAELESQLITYKRQQHSIHDESIIVEKENISIQTDPIPIPQPIIVQKKSIAEFGQTVNFVSQNLLQPSASFKSNNNIQNLPSFGAGGDADSIDPSKSLPNGHENIRLEKWKQAFAKSEEEKNRLIDFYEREMEDYKTKLALLPSQLYRQWQNQQEELGLLYPNNISSTTITPIGTPGKTPVTTREVSTETIQVPCKGANIQTEELEEDMVDGEQKVLKNDSNSKEIVAQVKLRNSTNKTCDSTFQSQYQTNNEKECSSVIIQTDETLETYHVLGTLIEQWAKEVAESTKRAEQAEKEVQLRREELQKVVGKYRELQITFSNSRKQWREEEKRLNKKIDENKERCITILNHVQEKLDIFE